MTKLLILRRVDGNSMLPGFKPGKLVFASYLKKYNIGNVIIAKKDGREVLKRISKVNRRGIWLISDNLNEGTDSRHYGPITHNQIIATVI